MSTRLPPALGRIARLDLARPTITGTPYPAETLTASRAGQWYADGSPIIGQTGATYTVGVADIGRSIRCGSGQSVTIWHPRDVPQVKAAWVPFYGVLNNIGPDVSATDGQLIRAWVDCVSGYRVGQTAGLRQPLFDVDAFGVGLPGLTFDGANTFLGGDSSVLGLIRNVGYAHLITAHKLGSSPTANSYVAAYNRTGAAGVMLGNSGRFSGGQAIVGCRRTFAQAVVILNLGTPSTGVVRVDTAQAEYQNNVFRGRRDGAQIGTAPIGTSGNSEDQDCADFCIGTFGAEVGANLFQGDIGAVIIAAGNLLMSNTDRNRLERFAGLCAGKSLSLSIS